METKTTLENIAAPFVTEIKEAKASIGGVNWYPYDSTANFGQLAPLLPGELADRLVAGGMRVLDIGPADGDMGWFFESRGCSVDFLDFPQTNYNNCRGLEALRSARGSHANLVYQDIDRGYSLNGQYDFALALGLLYHLRNPMGFLITLALHAERMVLSTSVLHRLPDGTDVSNASVGYLLSCRESNNDPTNFWHLSPKGLVTMLTRCGWNTLASHIAGDEDKRMFVYCERVPHWQGLWMHHDF